MHSVSFTLMLSALKSVTFCIAIVYSLMSPFSAFTYNFISFSVSFTSIVSSCMLFVEYVPSAIFTVAYSFSAVPFSLRLFIVSGIFISYLFSDTCVISDWFIPSASSFSKLLLFDAFIIVIS